MTSIDILVCIVALTFVCIIYVRRQRPPFPYPPSPKGYPIVGNLFSLPAKGHWPVYAAWARELGSPIISLNMMGKRVIILNDMQTTDDLLEKKGAMYSERPRMPYLNEAGGFDWVFSLTEDTERWRICRRETDAHLRQSNSRQYRPQQLVMAGKLLYKLLVCPDDFMDHCRYMADSLMLDVGYGIKVQIEGDKIINLTNVGSFGLEKSGDKNIINFFPLVQYIPSSLSWLPGMKWKAEVDKFKQWGMEMRDVPFMRVKEQLEAGMSVSSIAGRLLDSCHAIWPDQLKREEMVRNMMGATYIAGSDTTMSAFRFLILVLVLYPNVQQTAQEQLDRVVGSDRLPNFDDKQNLPYVTAICKELFRWATATAVPHSTAKDDVYRGYFIPKGTTILGNSWAILHDPEMFPDPEVFNPDRFLTPGGELNPDAPDITKAFGYGRRICPGQFLAQDSVWVVAASILAVFSISKAVDSNGKEIIPTVNNYSGLLNHPQAFQCEIKPRSKHSASLIEAIIGEDE